MWHKYFFSIVVSLFALIYSALSFADGIQVTFLSGPGYANNQGTPTMFNMVPNSTQQLKFIVNSSSNKIIKCSITTSSMDTVTNLGGCTNTNGAGTPYPLVFSITSGSTPGPVTHTLTIQTKSG